MKVLIVTPEMKKLIDEINETLIGRQIVPVEAENGILFLNADILTDCDSDQTWKEFRSILPKAEIFESDDVPVTKEDQAFTKRVTSKSLDTDQEVLKLREKFADVIAKPVKTKRASPKGVA